MTLTIMKVVGVVFPEIAHSSYMGAHSKRELSRAPSISYICHTLHQNPGRDFQQIVHQVCFCTIMGMELCLNCRTVQIHRPVKLEGSPDLSEHVAYKIPTLISPHTLDLYEIDA